jgi:hypothetical protein
MTYFAKRMIEISGAAMARCHANANNAVGIDKSYCQAMARLYYIDIAKWQCAMGLWTEEGDGYG